MKPIRRFIASGLLLTFSALIMRSISVSFGAYVSRTAGAEAMGVFSLIMSVFGFALTVATSGVNLAVTRMISEALGEGDEALLHKSMRKCTLYCLFFSLTSAFLLFMLSPFLGNNILHDIRTVRPLKILAVSLPFISLTSAYNGYFSAVRRVYKNTIYSVLEQLIKIFFTVKMFEIFLYKGIEFACIALVSADLISEFSAFIISGTMYYFDKLKYSKKGKSKYSDKEIKSKLFSIALPVAFSTYFRSSLLTIEHILIPKCLIQSGLERSAALSSYGTLHSMVFPIVLFPVSVLSSFSSLLIPELAEAKIKNKKTAVQYIARRAFQFSFIFSFLISGLLICFSDELGMMIYNSPEASHYIKLLAPLVPIMYIDGVTDSMLKGLGEQVYSMNVNIIDALLSIFFVVILLPKYGLSGYIVTIYITELVNFALSFFRLLVKTKTDIHIAKTLISPAFSIITTSFFVKAIFSFAQIQASETKILIVKCIFAVFVYYFLIRLTKGISKSDALWLKNVFFIKRYSEGRYEVLRDARKYSAPLQKERLRSIQKY